jgi:Domain of unknown function (DUF3291)
LAFCQITKYTWFPLSGNNLKVAITERVIYFCRDKIIKLKMEFYLAQINIAKMLAPIDSPVMADFVANLDNINTLAENSKGFVWRLRDESNNATAIKIFDDNFLIVNMSVWENREALFQFVYQSDHAEIFKRRKEWFEKMREMHMAQWYIPAGHLPTIAEAIERLNYLRNHGETPFSFSFKNNPHLDWYFFHISLRLPVDVIIICTMRVSSFITNNMDIHTFADRPCYKANAHNINNHGKSIL